MDIKHSRRILAIGHPDSGVLDVIKGLTGSFPPTDPSSNSTAGLSHEWDVETAYYSARVPIWIDELSDTETWKAEFLKPEAKEVVEALGAWIYCFRPQQRASRTDAADNGAAAAGGHVGIGKEEEEVMKAVQEISEAHAGVGGADVAMLAVAVPQSTSSKGKGKEAQVEECEDICLQYGFEYIDYASTKPNEFGEKTGIPRLIESLEANEWADTAASDLETGLLDDIETGRSDFGGDDLQSGFEVEEAEMTAELFGIKSALAEGREDEIAGVHEDGSADDASAGRREHEQVEDLERLMSRLLTVKEQSADLPEAERRRVAAQAVRQLLAE